jgi:hypothetical protein
MLSRKVNRYSRIVRLRFEDLTDRITPSIYTWTAASFDQANGNANWSNLANWSWDGVGDVPSAPKASRRIILLERGIDILSC